MLEYGHCNWKYYKWRLDLYAVVWEGVRTAAHADSCLPDSWSPDSCSPDICSSGYLLTKQMNKWTLAHQWIDNEKENKLKNNYFYFRNIFYFYQRLFYLINIVMCTFSLTMNIIYYWSLNFNPLIIGNIHPNNYIGNRILRNIFLNKNPFFYYKFTFFLLNFHWWASVHVFISCWATVRVSNCPTPVWEHKVGVNWQ